MTQTKTISVQKGLNELKLYGSKIDKAIEDLLVANIAQKNKLVTTVKGITDPVEFADKGQALYDSVLAMIKNRQAIKSAIILSNAVTEVVIDGNKMTVAEAIELKDSISFQQALVRKLRVDFLGANVKVDRKNEALKEQTKKTIEQIMGKDKENPTPELLASIEAQEEKDKFFIVEGVKNLSETIDLSSDRIANFLSEVDFVLTESNVKTDITFEV